MRISEGFRRSSQNFSRIEVNLAWEKSRHFATPTTGFPSKWRLGNERRNSILMTRHYPDLIGWRKFPTRHDPSEALPTDPCSDTSSVSNFCARFSDIIGGETSGSVAKCWLFSQATVDLNLNWILTEMMTLGLDDTTKIWIAFIELNLAQLNMAISKVFSKCVHWRFY